MRSFSIFNSRFMITRSGGHGVAGPNGRAGTPLPAVLGLAAALAFAALSTPAVRAAAAAADPAPTSVVATADIPTVIVVMGVEGDQEYGNVFAAQSDAWAEIVKSVGAKGILIGGPEASTATDRERLKAALASEAKQGRGELWLVMIGHGTFDGKEAKFNLRGPDVTTADLTEWLKPFARPMAIIDTSSASAPFLNKLSGAGRVVITATRSGAEENYTRFGTHFVKALLSPDSDFDKDGQVSLLEAFLAGSANLAEFYKTEGRLASEHPLIDDNGDGLGTPPDWFRGVRAIKRAANNAAPDGPRALQLALIHSAMEKNLSPEVKAQRDALELKLAALRETKARLDEDEYYRQLEQILLQISALYPKSG